MALAVLSMPAQNKKNTTRRKATATSVATGKARKHATAASKNKAKAPSKAPQKTTAKGKRGLKKTAVASDYSNATIRGLRTQRADIQRKIKIQEQLLKKNKADVMQRLSHLMAINSEIDQREKSINGIQKDIHHIEGNIGMLKNQLSQLELQLQDRKAKYVKSMRYQPHGARQTDVRVQCKESGTDVPSHALCARICRLSACAR